MMKQQPEVADPSVREEENRNMEEAGMILTETRNFLKGHLSDTEADQLMDSMEKALLKSVT